MCVEGFTCLSSESSSCLPHLTHLDISSCDLSFITWPWLHTPPLRVLNLARNTVSIAAVHTLARHCGKTLERLDLDHAIWPPSTPSIQPYPCFNKEASSFESLRTLNISHWGPWDDWRDGLFDGGGVGRGSSGSGSSGSGSGSSSGSGNESMARSTSDSPCSAAEESLLSMVTLPLSSLTLLLPFPTISLP